MFKRKFKAVFKNIVFFIGFACIFDLFGCKKSVSPTTTAPPVPDITPGTFTRSVMHDGLTRGYRLYIPPSFDVTEPAALVIGLHGGRVTGESMELLTLGGLNALADSNGFVLVYPNAFENNWNDGREVQIYPSHVQNIDDVGFISNLIDTLVTNFNLDSRRVYVTGASNGALMAHRLACELSGKIAAIAPVMGTMPEKIISTCSPSQPISVLQIHGTEDPTVPWEGGNVKFVRDVLGTVISVPATMMHWVTHNNCAQTPIVTMEPDIDPADSTRVRQERYSQCRENVDVVLFAIEGGGHTWPGGLQYLPEERIGRTSRDIVANQVIWNFFKNQSL